MGKPSLAEQLALEKAKREADEDEAQRTLRLTVRFPDLHRYVNRWGQVRLSTAGVNALAADCEIGHSCGCCYDSPVQVWPFAVLEGVKVYSDPLPFLVGQGGFFGGEEPHEGWEENLRSNGIPEGVIKQVANFFAANPPGEDEDEDEDE